MNIAEGRRVKIWRIFIRQILRAKERNMCIVKICGGGKIFSTLAGMLCNWPGDRCRRDLAWRGHPRDHQITGKLIRLPVASVELADTPNLQ